MTDVDAEWMRQEARRHGIALSDDDVDAMRAPLARVKALLRVIRSEIEEGLEPAFQYRLEPWNDEVEGGDR